MDRDGLSEKALEKRSGVSQKGINKILNKQSAPTVTTIAKLAQAFRIEPWQLLMPPGKHASDKEWQSLLQAYASASPEGRDLILRLAERETRRPEAN